MKCAFCRAMAVWTVAGWAACWSAAASASAPAPDLNDTAKQTDSTEQSDPTQRIDPTHEGDPADVSRARPGPDRGDSKDADDQDEKTDLPPMADVIKDMQTLEGLFTLYRKDDKVLASIPKALLNKDILIASSISSAPRLAGFQWTDLLVRFERMDKKLLMVEPDVRYTSSKNATVADVVKRTYTDKIRRVMDIVTVSKKGDVVIDLGDIFKTDLVGIGEAMQGKFDRSLSRWSKVKSFPKNLELAVESVVKEGDKPAQRVKVSYSIAALPDDGYKPREADERIGYFIVPIKDWSTSYNDRTIFKRYISRWSLEKEAPGEEQSPVKAPIVFYLEKTIPAPYRRYVAEGILEWNKAFEKLGYLGVMQVRQQTDQEFSDLDPEDMRYNFIRWIVSGRPFAMGPSRVDPRTGQILDADIIFDDTMTRYVIDEYATLGAPLSSYFDDPLLDRFLSACPQWDRPEFEARAGGLAEQTDETERSWNLAEALLASQGKSTCSYGQGMVRELALLGDRLAAGGNSPMPLDLLGAAIKETVMHEVGHTLGLRHNFKASSWLPLDEICKRTDGKRAITASVMDYNPYNYNPKEVGATDFVTGTLGPYDFWAIEYGYRPADKKGDEAKMLAEIAAHSAEPGHCYATDEDTSFMGPDPRVNQWDVGDDPIYYAKHRMQLIRELQQSIMDWSVAEGESFSQLRQRFDRLLKQYGRAALFAAREIGGQYVNRDHKGDPNGRPAFQVVPAAKQREALSFVSEAVFGDQAFQFSPRVINHLAAGRWKHWDSDNWSEEQEYRIHEQIASLQYAVLFQVLNPFTVTRLYDAELKVGADADALTLREMLHSVCKTIWSELDHDANGGSYTDRKPFVSSIRRGLQRLHLKTMIDLVVPRGAQAVPADARAVTYCEMEDLAGRIAKTLEAQNGLDAFSIAHLTEAKARIDKALSARYELGGEQPEAPVRTRRR